VKTPLKVPFDQSGKAQRLGARWDPARKYWYVPDGVDLTPFLRWLPEAPKLSKKVLRVLRGPVIGTARRSHRRADDE
jgi:hypothetical protein